LVEAAQRVELILYFGDHDPGGLGIQDTIERELRDTWGAGCILSRIALTPSQIEQHNLPPAPAKDSTRTPRFVAQYGMDTVELDALPPEVLRGFVEAAIEGVITDPDAWARQRRREQREQRKLRTLLSSK